MEDILQTQGLLALWDEEEMADDAANWQASITTFLVMGVQLEQEGRLAQTRGHWTYLTHPELMPDPQLASPWLNLYYSYNVNTHIFIQ